MNVIKAANKRFNDFLDRVSPLYDIPLGYGEFDREELDMPVHLDNPDDEVVDYSQYFVK